MSDITENTLSSENTPRSAQIDASDQLNHVIHKIISSWEAQVRKDFGPASRQTGPVLRNQLQDILENLVTNISPSASKNSFTKAGEIGRSHGTQRAGLLDFTFSQVLNEYSILRKVVFNVLEEEKLLNPQVRDIIIEVLDEGLEKALESFSFLKSEDLKRSNQDLEHFAAIAAHDLKSPLATIAGYAELLEIKLKTKLTPEELKYIRAINGSANRMSQLINRLLEYSSVGREIKPFEDIDMNIILKDVLENLNTTIVNMKAQVRVEELPHVFGDKSLLTQLFQNIVSNALKFSSPDRFPEINIKCRSEGLLWLFSIQDNGVGFDPKEQDNIFSLYKRLDTTKEVSGLGIGLATARKVVELHGGSLWAESTPNEGSTFFFTLPKIH